MGAIILLVWIISLVTSLNDKLAALKGKWLERDDVTDPKNVVFIVIK